MGTTQARLEECSEDCCYKVDELLEWSERCLETAPEYNYYNVHILIRLGEKGVYSKLRPVPSALKTHVHKELERLEEKVLNKMKQSEGTTPVRESETLPMLK